jgi:Family of unknown function (DUF5995)
MGQVSARAKSLHGQRLCMGGSSQRAWAFKRLIASLRCPPSPGLEHPWGFAYDSGVGATGEISGWAAEVGGAGTITDVIAKMQQIDASLPYKDGVAYFNRLYLQVTQAVLAASQNTPFEDPAFLDLLDVVFAGLYFDAEATIASGASCPVAWRPLTHERSAPRAPIQFALAGMNAHINHDLPLAVVQTCRQLGVAVDDNSPQHADYERVNAILATVETQIAGWFDSGLIADVEDVVPQDVANAIAMWSVVTAREIAWDHARVLWNLRDRPDLASAYTDVLARTTELSGWAMLV